MHCAFRIVKQKVILLKLKSSCSDYKELTDIVLYKNTTVLISVTVESGFTLTELIYQLLLHLITVCNRFYLNFFY